MSFLKSSITIILLFFSLTIFAQKYKNSGSQHASVTTTYKDSKFDSNKSLLENLKGVNDISIFTKGLNDDVLQKQLNSEEMVTVFIFTNSSFNELPKKIKDSLTNNTGAMRNFLEFYMVNGRVDANSLKVESEKNKGKTFLSTINGEKLGAKLANGNIELIDEKGKIATLEGKDFYYKKGLFHILKGVVMPTISE